MDISKLCGVVPPVVTPLDEEKKFDKKSFENVINKMIDAGVDGLFVLGSTGSVAFLTKDEREEVIAAADKINNGRVPLLVGCIDTQTNRVIEHIKVCEKYNVDAIVATAPFYALDGQDNVERHFRLLNEATKLPIFAYDLPVCVHKKLDHNLLVKLGREGVLVGVKDSSGDDVAFRYLCMKNEETGHPLRVFTGHEIVVDGALMSGADGVVPGLGNVDPHVYVDMFKAYNEGDFESVKKLQDKAARVMLITTCTEKPMGFGSGVGGFMTALKLMGIISTNYLPEPTISLSESEANKVSEILKNEGLL